MDIVEQQTESLELLTNALQILLGKSCSLFEVVTSISSCSQRAAALQWGNSMTLLALNCRGDPAAVPGLGHLCSAPESRALGRGVGAGAADQGAPLCHPLALHTGEGHGPALGLSGSALV